MQDTKLRHFSLTKPWIAIDWEKYIRLQHCSTIRERTTAWWVRDSLGAALNCPELLRFIQSARGKPKGSVDTDNMRFDLTPARMCASWTVEQISQAFHQVRERLDFDVSSSVLSTWRVNTKVRCCIAVCSRAIRLTATKTRCLIMTRMGLKRVYRSTSLSELENGITRRFSTIFTYTLHREKDAPTRVIPLLQRLPEMILTYSSPRSNNYKKALTRGLPNVNVSNSTSLSNP